MKPHIDLFAGLDSRPILGSASQKAGLYYERAVCEWFERRFLCARQPAVSWPGVWRRRRFPDLLVFPSKRLHSCVVVEVKHQFIESSVWQVRDYADAIGRAWPFCSVRMLIVCAQVLSPSGLEECILHDGVKWPVNGRPLVGVLSKRELRMDRLHGLDCDPPGAVRESGSVGHGVRCRGELSGVAAKA